MPTSHEEGKDWVKRLYELRSGLLPVRVVDIGPGEGTYFDLLKTTKPSAKWTGVEIWAPYIIEYGLEKRYDDVVVSDGLYVDPEIFEDSFVIACDVLEHLPADGAVALLQRISAHSRGILFSVPVIPCPQGWVNGNPYEQHLYHWSYEEVQETLVPVVEEHFGGFSRSFHGEILGYWWIEAE